MKPEPSTVEEPQETVQTAFRLPADLVAGLDAYAGRQRVATPGKLFTRADVVRVALYAFLTREETREARKASPAQTKPRKRTKP